MNEDYYTTVELRDSLQADYPDERFTVEKVESLLFELEEQGVVRHVGTTENGHNMWDVTSKRRAIAFYGKHKTLEKLGSLKRRFIGGGEA